MEKEKIVEWMDKLVENHNERKALNSFSEGIKTADTIGYIQIYQGIDILADAAGEELKEKEDEALRYPYEYFFTYKGVEFTQLEKERLMI